MDWEDVDGEIQDIPNAHFDVLNSSLPGYMTREWRHTSPLLQLTQDLASTVTTNTVLGTPSDPRDSTERAGRSLLNTFSSAVTARAQQSEKPLQKPKWHFGIRSRSPPMEVMLEIYKTLNILGMEWRRKDSVQMPEIGPPPPGGYPEEVEAAIGQWVEQGGMAPQMGRKMPIKKDVAAQDKAAQGLYLVETRARYGDVMVSGEKPMAPPSERF